MQNVLAIILELTWAIRFLDATTPTFKMCQQKNIVQQQNDKNICY